MEISRATVASCNVHARFIRRSPSEERQIIDEAKLRVIAQRHNKRIIRTLFRVLQYTLCCTDEKRVERLVTKKLFPSSSESSLIQRI